MLGLLLLALTAFLLVLVAGLSAIVAAVARGRGLDVWSASTLGVLLGPVALVPVHAAARRVGLRQVEEESMRKWS